MKTPGSVVGGSSVSKQPTLMFIYGPPAAGKLTVATALAERTGFKVFHNHATFDLAASLLPVMSPPFIDLIERLRLDVIDVAMRAGTDLIFTFAFADPEDRPFVARTEEVVAAAGGRVCFVHLRPTQAELERRVLETSRASHGKLRDIDTLRGVLLRWGMHTSIHEDDFALDNTEIPAADVAEQIQRHYGL